MKTFFINILLYFEKIKDTATVKQKTPYAIYQMVPFPMTLNRDFKVIPISDDEYVSNGTIYVDSFQNFHQTTQQTINQTIIQ